jgi:transposase
MAKRERRFYPTNYATDVTDEQWARIEPLVRSRSSQGGRPNEIDLRAVLNALLYKNRTGCQWRLLPADFRPMSSVRYYFDKWNADGTLVKVNDVLRKAARKALFRDEEPSISLLGSQSTKTTDVGGERGVDGGKKGQRSQTSILG